MPNMTQKIPPITGSGMETRRAPNLENTPKKSKNPAAHWITRRLPTFWCSLEQNQRKHNEKWLAGASWQSLQIFNHKKLL